MAVTKFSVGHSNRCRKLTAPQEAAGGAVGLASLKVAWRVRSRMWHRRMIVVDNTTYHIPDYSSHVVLPLVSARDGMA